MTIHAALRCATCNDFRAHVPAGTIGKWTCLYCGKERELFPAIIPKEGNMQDQTGGQNAVGTVPESPAEEEGQKRTRETGELRACVVPVKGTYIVVDRSPVFATLREAQRWIADFAIPGVPYSTVRVPTTEPVTYAFKREVMA